MSAWTVMNIVAWVLCAAILIYLVVDVIRVEKDRAKEKKGAR